MKKPYLIPLSLLIGAIFGAIAVSYKEKPQDGLFSEGYQEGYHAAIETFYEIQNPLGK